MNDFMDIRAILANIDTRDQSKLCAIESSTGMHGSVMKSTLWEEYKNEKAFGASNFFKNVTNSLVDLCAELLHLCIEKGAYVTKQALAGIFGLSLADPEDDSEEEEIEVDDPMAISQDASSTSIAQDPLHPYQRIRAVYHRGECSTCLLCSIAAAMSIMLG